MGWMPATHHDRILSASDPAALTTLFHGAWDSVSSHHVVNDRIQCSYQYAHLRSPQHHQSAMSGISTPSTHMAVMQTSMKWGERTVVNAATGGFQEASSWMGSHGTGVLGVGGQHRSYFGSLKWRYESSPNVAVMTYGTALYVPQKNVNLHIKNISATWAMACGFITERRWGEGHGVQFHIGLPIQTVSGHATLEHAFIDRSKIRPGQGYVTPEFKHERVSLKPQQRACNIECSYERVPSEGLSYGVLASLQMNAAHGTSHKRHDHGAMVYLKHTF